jgi:hypothetical protein
VFHLAGSGQEGLCGALFDELPILTVSRVPAVTTGKWRAEAQPMEVWAGTMSAIEQPILGEAREAPVVNGKGYKARLVDYNNDPATTFDDVKKYFNGAFRAVAVLAQRVTRKQHAHQSSIAASRC